MRRWDGGEGAQRINDFPILTRFSFGIQDGMQRDINLRKSVEKLGHLWATHFMPAKQMCNLKVQERWRETNLKKIKRQLSAFRHFDSWDGPRYTRENPFRNKQWLTEDEQMNSTAEER